MHLQLRADGACIHTTVVRTLSALWQSHPRQPDHAGHLDDVMPRYTEDDTVNTCGLVGSKSIGCRIIYAVEAAVSLVR